MSTPQLAPVYVPLGAAAPQRIIDWLERTSTGTDGVQVNVRDSMLARFAANGGTFHYGRPEYDATANFTPDMLAGLAANAQPHEHKWWVIITRYGGENYDEDMPDLVFGPYLNERLANKAAEDSLLVDDACGNTKNPYCVDDCYTADKYEEGSEVIVINRFDHAHTGLIGPNLPPEYDDAGSAHTYTEPLVGFDYDDWQHLDDETGEPLEDGA